tara:strand:+ start:220 stop:423 length:204 start_codon:yes stop_codon:yes gene_type:complete
MTAGFDKQEELAKIDQAITWTNSHQRSKGRQNVLNILKQRRKSVEEACEECGKNKSGGCADYNCPMR